MPGINNSNLKHYLAYGLTLETDFDLSRYLTLPRVNGSVLRILERSGSPPNSELNQNYPLNISHGRQILLVTDRSLELSVPGQPWFFEVAGIVRFHWVGHAALIEYELLDGGDKKLLAFWLIHIFLPLWKTLEDKCEFIHACAVEINGEPVLFTAPSMGGKSTLTRHFLKRRHGLVSDDKVGIAFRQNEFVAIPSHPNFRPYRKFEDLGLRAEAFCSHPVPIRAIFSLKKANPEAEVQVTAVRGHRKFAVVRPSYLFDFPFLQERRLRFVADMADLLAVYEVELPWRLNRLGEVYSKICELCD